MKKLILGSLAILLISCEARLDNDKRAFFNSKIIGPTGMPIADARVQITNFRTFEFVGSTQYAAKFSPAERDFLLGQGVTDEKGEVDFLMLFDTASQYFINITLPDGSARTITADIESFNDDLTLNIPVITLKEIASIELEFINTSGTTDQIPIEVDFFALYCSEAYNNNEFTVDENCAIQSEIWDIINQEPNDGNFDFKVFYPSTITISYQDRLGNQVTEELMVNNPNERYEINY